MNYLYANPQSLLLPWLIPMVVTGCAILLGAQVSEQNLPMIYVLGVLFTATRTGLWPGLICATVSFLSYNWFFTEPRYSLRMLDQGEILTATLLMATAMMTGQLAGRLKGQVDALHESQDWNDCQVACARDLAAANKADTIIQNVAHHLSEALHWHVRDTETNWLPDGEFPAGPGLHVAEDPGGVTLHFVTTDHTGVAALRASARERIDESHRKRYTAIIHLAELAWTRVALAESLRCETLDKEREQLRTALLSSISHDLRTPLSTMIGSVSSLIDLADSLGSSERGELLANTLSEARRLDRYIQKLLDMTRLGHGELSLDRDWVGLDDIIEVVLRRLEPIRHGHAIDVVIDESLPLLHVHPALIEQALFNVLENAIRFSPGDEPIKISAWSRESQVCVDVHDTGPGVLPENRERVFDMFHTFSHGDQFEGGTGLGLPICRSIVAAHGGTVSIVDPADALGTTVRICLPATGELQDAPDDE